MFSRTASKLAQLSIPPGIPHLPYNPPPTTPLPAFMRPELSQRLHPQSMPAPRKHVIPAVWMRAGTSKGLFLRREHLPPLQKAWARPILGIMGSLDGDKNQLNGIGGGSSTTSKVAVVSKSLRPDADVDYTFVQVPVGKGTLDFSGNCGNIASGVGPFAVDEGFIEVPKGAKKVSDPYELAGRLGAHCKLTQYLGARSCLQYQYKSPY